jgi:hypothetical protein
MFWSIAFHQMKFPNTLLMKQSFKQRFFRALSNLPGWRTKRKILVIESDDWGSIRIPSREAFEQMRNAGIPMHENAFTTYDCLEDDQDLEHLIRTLSAIRDQEGNHPVITAMSLTENPDFSAIKHAKFQQYFSESVTETRARYGGRTNVADLIQEGIEQRVYEPQFHGKEHLNIKAWMRCLRQAEAFPATHLAFKHGISGLHPWMAKEDRIDFQAAFHLANKDELPFLRQVLKEGIAGFKTEYKMAPTYFVPPNGPYHNLLDDDLKTLGIKYLCAAKNRQQPEGDGQYSRHFHYLGQQLENGITMLTRNVVFEPAIVPNQERLIENTLADMASAFFFRKPVIISSHRVNYVGGIDPENREKGFSSLAELLRRALRRWPDITFMSSAQLGQFINASRGQH